MSLDLDERQRAMLKEMGVTVWWPKPAAPLVSVDVATDRPAISSASDPAILASKNIASNINLNQKIDQKINEIELNNVAISQTNTRLISSNNQDENLENKYFKTDVAIANLNWPALQHTVSQCRACALCEGRRQTVFGVGQNAAGEDAAPEVDWLIVGEAPGENEDRVGEPFVGQAGQLLDNMLKAMQLSRKSSASSANSPTPGVYIVNVIKCRPPGNRNPSPQEVAQCEPYLHRQIALLQPKIILAMGKFAAASLLRATLPEVDKTPLGRLRGQVHTYTHEDLSIPVVATYHPAYLLRSLTEKAKSWEDLCLALNSLAQRQRPIASI